MSSGCLVFQHLFPYRRRGTHRVSSVPLSPLSLHLANLSDSGGRYRLLPLRSDFFCLRLCPQPRLPQLGVFGTQSVQCAFRLGELAPIRLTLTLPLRVQWVATGGWLNLTEQGFPAEITEVYQWRLSQLSRISTIGNTHLLYVIYKARCVDSSHGH